MATLGSKTYQMEPENSWASLSFAVHSLRMRSICEPYDGFRTAIGAEERRAYDFATTPLSV